MSIQTDFEKKWYYPSGEVDAELSSQEMATQFEDACQQKNAPKESQRMSYSIEFNPADNRPFYTNFLLT